MYRIGCKGIRKINLESEGHNGNNNNKLEKPSKTVLLREQNNYFKL